MGHVGRAAVLGALLVLGFGLLLPVSSRLPSAYGWQSSDQGCRWLAPSGVSYYFLGTVSAGWTDATRTYANRWRQNGSLPYNITESSNGSIGVRNFSFGSGDSRVGYATAKYSGSVSCTYPNNGPYDTLQGGRPGITSGSVNYNSAYDSYAKDTKGNFVVHEFGHVLGLDHSQYSSAVMDPSPYRNTLAPDDENGARELVR